VLCVAVFAVRDCRQADDQPTLTLT